MLEPATVSSLWRLQNGTCFTFLRAQRKGARAGGSGRKAHHEDRCLKLTAVGGQPSHRNIVSQPQSASATSCLFLLAFAAEA